MLCPKCGAWVPDDSIFCSKCGFSLKQEQSSESTQQAPQSTEIAPAQPQPESAPTPKPEKAMPTYLTQNILLTVFSVVCCFFFALPTSVTGLVFSAIAQGDLNRGDLVKANQDIKLARIFMWISFGLEIAVVAVLIIRVVFFSASLGGLFTQLLHNGNFNFQWD